MMAKINKFSKSVFCELKILMKSVPEEVTEKNFWKKLLEKNS